MRRLLTLTIALLLPTAAFANPQEVTTATPSIGLLLPLSGQYAALGTDVQQGIEIAARELPPNLPLNLRFADSRADPITSIAEFRKLAHAEKIIGAFAFRGPVGMAINPISRAHQIPLLGGVGNKEFTAQNEYAFQMWPPSDREGAFLATQIARLGLKRIALLTAQDDWPISVSDGFRGAAVHNGLEIEYDQETLPSEVDWRSQISRVKQKRPDAIVLNLSLHQIGPCLRQIRDAGLQAPAFSNFWAGKKEVITAAGSAADGMRFVEISTNYDKLKVDLAARFQANPSGATLSGYVAMHTLGQALQGLKDTTTRGLYDRLLSLSEVPTPNGTFTIHNRIVDFPLTIRVIRNGEISDPTPL